MGLGVAHHLEAVLDRRLIEKEVEGLFDEVSTDPIGNLICRRDPRAGIGDRAQHDLVQTILPDVDPPALLPASRGAVPAATPAACVAACAGAFPGVPRYVAVSADVRRWFAG